MLPWWWAEQRLKKSHNYWITTVTGRASRQLHTLFPLSTHMVIWGLWQDGCFLFCTGARVAQGQKPGAQFALRGVHRRRSEAVIVEGVAEIADIAARRRMLPVYERKYKFDMGKMKNDILSMKEPVFAVRPRVAFGLWEKHFVGKSTRWTFD